MTEQKIDTTATSELTEATEPTDAPEPVVEPTEAPAEPEPASGTHVEPDTNNKAAREAAKYRTRLRETEQHLNQTQASLQAAREEALQYAALKHRFGDTSSEQANSPIIIEDALKDHTFDTDKLYTPEGNINQAALKEELEALLESKPYYFRHRIGAYVPDEGKTPFEYNISRHSFTEAFRPEGK